MRLRGSLQSVKWRHPTRHASKNLLAIWQKASAPNSRRNRISPVASTCKGRLRSRHHWPWANAKTSSTPLPVTIICQVWEAGTRTSWNKTTTKPLHMTMKSSTWTSSQKKARLSTMIARWRTRPLSHSCSWAVSSSPCFKLKNLASHLRRKSILKDPVYTNTNSKRS
jgi:hypothetical protein